MWSMDYFCLNWLLILILSWIPLFLYWLSRELLWNDFTWSDIVLIPSYPVLTQSQTALGWFYLVWYCLDSLLSCTDSVANCSGMILLGLILSWLTLILYWLSRKLLWDDFTWSDIVLIDCYPVLSQSRTALGWFYLVRYCLDYLLSCTDSVANCSGMILLAQILSWFPLILYCRELLWDNFTWSDIVLITSYPVLTQSRTALGWFYLVWYCLDWLLSCTDSVAKLLWDDFTWSDIVLIDCYPVLTQSRTALGWFYLLRYCLHSLLSCTDSVANCSGMILLGLILSWFPLILYCRELLWDDFIWSDIVLINLLSVLTTDSVANCSGMILLAQILSWFPLILYCRELLWDDFTWSDIVLIPSYPVLTQLRTALGWFYLLRYCLYSLLSCTDSVANCSGMI